MSDEMLKSITYIKSVSKKKVSFDKILVHLCKWELSIYASGELVNRRPRWSENAVKLVDEIYKINPN